MFSLIVSVIFPPCGRPSRGTRSGVIVLYFPCVEGPHVEPAVRFCVIFSACVGSARGTRSEIIVLYFLHVERDLALLCYMFLHVEHTSVILYYIFRV